MIAGGQTVTFSCMDTTTTALNGIDSFLCDTLGSVSPTTAPSCDPSKSFIHKQTRNLLF